MEGSVLEFVYPIVVKIIEENRNKDLNEAQLEIVMHANLIKIIIDKAPDVLKGLKEKIKDNPDYKDVILSEEDIVNKALEENKLFKRLSMAYSVGTEVISGFTTATILELWNQSTTYSGIEKYFNTPDNLFNSNAFHWHIALKTNKLFTDIELPFKILFRYFDFLKSPDKPISCLDKVIQDFEKHKLTIEQRIFILDRFTGMLYHSNDPELSNIFILLVDKRHDLSSYLDDPEIKNNIWSIESLRDESEKLTTILERKRFFRLKKLEYEKESDKLGFDFGLKEEIDIELKYLEELEGKDSLEKDNIDEVFKNKDITNIGNNAYKQIIEYILILGKNLEKLKDLTQSFDEEKCRDYFLPFLNSISENHSATGETFNKIGKTDILIQNNIGENIFIGECKIWQGESNLLEAIDQLLDRYVNWRDEKLAIIIFNKKNKDFSNVIETAIDTLKKHSNFDTYIGLRQDTSYSFIYKHPSDENKLVSLELILFNFE